MSTIEEQLALEQRMVAQGINRYHYSVDAAEGNERAADTKYAQTLMREFITPVSDVIKAYCAEKTPGKAAKYKSLLRLVDPEKAAYFGLRCLINHFMRDSNLVRLANHIGMMVEDEIKFSKFHRDHGDYYETIIRDFKKKGTKSYRHMHRVLTYKANEKSLGWNSWSTEDKASVGTKILDCILKATDLIEIKRGMKKGKKFVEINPSEDAKKWIKDYHAYAELLNPDRMPCLIPPDDWSALDAGGYYTPQMRHRTKMVKTRSRAHEKMFDGDIDNITSALNTIQNVPWQVNLKVYEVFHEVWKRAMPIGLPQSEPYLIPACPIQGKDKKAFTEKEKQAFDDWKSEARMVYTMEKERVSKCFQVIRVLRMASEYRQHNRFWYVYQCDFRGRIYATTSGFSPQGPDFAKGLITFANGKIITARGAYWLKIHVANMHGQDKLSYADRVKWTEENKNQIVAVAKEPMSHHSWWGSADKPWQFLAACFEYARYTVEGDKMVSYLPISLDGSCNGLQNFSAMLRDPIGGKATNLIPGDKPEDIYSTVAAACTQNLRLMPNSENKTLWLAYADAQPGKTLPRSAAKRPVMTLPYGSTRQSCREYIYQFIAETAPAELPKEKWFSLSVYLTPIMWASIGQIVVAARQAMAWIQNSAGVVAKADKPLVWWSPIGFPVYQERRVVKARQIRTELAGQFRLFIGDSYGRMDVRKAKLGASPNFVHSMDACHLMMACNRAVDYGVQDFAFIHDDYGTHAAETDTLHQAIRESFYELYNENKPLIDFKVFNEDNSGVSLPEMPAEGVLKLDQVLDSEYFFG